MIARHREVTHLSLAQARVLLTPEMAEGLLGVNLAHLAQGDEILLPEALDGQQGTAAEWRARLEALCVPLLDVNTASVESLLRIPGLSVDEARTLVEARPYLDLEELGHEGPDLQAIGARVAPYVGHDGYLFVDKPSSRMVALDVDLAAGVLVRGQAGTDPAALAATLDAAGLRGLTEDTQERLWLCGWEASVPAAKRASCLRALKSSGAVASVAPVLRDRLGQLRMPYPDRLDAMLVDGAGDAAWEYLTATHDLVTVARYLPYYGSLRVTAHPHDLGALYRALRTLAEEEAVRFVEPTYLVV